MHLCVQLLTWTVMFAFPAVRGMPVVNDMGMQTHAGK